MAWPIIARKRPSRRNCTVYAAGRPCQIGSNAFYGAYRRLGVDFVNSPHISSRLGEYEIHPHRVIGKVNSAIVVAVQNPGVEKRVNMEWK